MTHRAAIAACLVAAAACDDAPPPLPAGATLAMPVARVTIAAPSEADQLVDPAIWVHPQYPSQSLVLGARTGGGLAWYGLDGRRLGAFEGPDACATADVAYRWRLGDREVDVVAATTASDEPDLVVWSIDPEPRVLELVGRAAVGRSGDAGVGALTLHRRVRDGALFAFTGNDAGRVEQHRLDGASGALEASLVRTFEVGGAVSGLVADDERGAVFVAVAGSGVWRVGAEPDAPATPRDRARVLTLGTPGLGAGIGGMALYAARGGRGFLLVALTDVDRVLVLDREPPHPVRKVVEPRPGPGVDDLRHLAGIAVEGFALGATFESGVLVLQGDGGTRGRRASQLFAWRDAAGIDLLVDAERDPRRPHRVR